MPTVGRSRKAVRMDDTPWEDFGEAVARLGYDRSEVLREFVDWFTYQPDRVTYRRPAPRSQAES
jgi:hypothetical protein